MKTPAYPTDIVTNEGWERIHQGHDLDRATLLSDLAQAQGDTQANPHIEEVHLSYQPHVKWCSKHGDPCDSEGEWHGHWHAVRVSDDLNTKFTLVRANTGS